MFSLTPVYLCGNGNALDYKGRGCEYISTSMVCACARVRVRGRVHVRARTRVLGTHALSVPYFMNILCGYVQL